MLSLLRSPWGRDTALRGLAGALLTMLVVCAVGAATDEGGVAWPLRVSRSLPLVPVCSGAGAWLALGAARTRGELVALGALGAAPSRTASAACAGAAAVSVGAAIAIALLPGLDVGAFFPAARSGGVWTHDGAGFVDGAGQVRILGTGEIARIAGAPMAHQAGLGGARAAAAIVTAAAGVALALVLARTHARNAARTASVLAGFGVVIVVSLQAAAANVGPIVIAPAVAILLLVASVLLYRASDA